MASDTISPLKINKTTTPGASPARTSSGNAMPRALAEISPMEKRRNSPSYNQVTKQMIATGRDSSPFDSSPYGTASPKAFWQRGASPARFSSENWLDRSDSSASMSKRPSIERLKQASRVKNSSMFAREQKNEYDPFSVPVVERPLAGNRPLSQLTGNTFGGRGIEGQRQETASNTPNSKGHRRGESQNKIPLFNKSTSTAPSDSVLEKSPSPSPSRSQPSPTKSSLSTRTSHNTFPRHFDPNSSIWSDEDNTEINFSPPRALRRQAKSVTFDTKPPEINEYEMVTPDPSVASVTSGSREGSYDDYDDELDLGYGPNEDDSFDASLEDTDKTPVVLPDDWRHMSPDVADASLAKTFDDPFGHDDNGRSTPSQQWNAYRTMSVNSDSESRPLPALPPYLQEAQRPSSAMSVEDRVKAAHTRTLPTPPRPCNLTRSEMVGIKKDTSMSIEDRLRLMGLDDNRSPSDSAVKEAARLSKHGLGIHVSEEEVPAEEEPTPMAEFKLPRISRESILRKVQSRTFDHANDDNGLPIFEEEQSYGDLDPDVPIPSRETSSQFDEHVMAEPDIYIKQEEEDDAIDVYSIPEMYSELHDDDFDREGSVIRHDIPGADNDVADDESCYSPDLAMAGAQQGSNSATDDEGPPTPKQEPVIRTSTPRISGGSDGSTHIPLPELSLLDDTDFQSGFASYLGGSSTPPPPPEKDTPSSIARPAPVPTLDMCSVQSFLRRESHDDSDGEEPGTPSSVVHHPIERESPEEQEEEVECPAVPEPKATIKAPGSRLKTRVSATPADLNTMAAVRRKVSGAEAPPIPDKSPKRLSMSLEPDVQIEKEDTAALDTSSPTKRRQSFRGIDIMDESFGEDISFGIDKEFDRVIESSKVRLFPLPSSATFEASAQPPGQGVEQEQQHFSYVNDSSTHADMTPRTKKGYLMRQNTKVVVAKRNFSNESNNPMSPTWEQRPSSSGTRSAGSSPRKPSHERSKSWTTEPWNGKSRRRSIRTLSNSRKAPPSGPVPPLPGQESAVTAGLDTVVEDQVMDQTDDLEDGVERGRLFVKVVGVKELDLPLPQNERTYFQLTLDNGLHCVTTSWLELGRTAPIGQEFELVVLNDLEFQLTLQTKLTPPAKPAAALPPSPSKAAPKSPNKKTSFSHLLMSPKKRREQERLAKEKQEQEEAQRLIVQRQNEEAARARRGRNPNSTAWELLNELVGSDGSFGRAYVCLKNHEDQCFGRPITVDMPIFNEWALEDATIANSVKSKRGGAVRRPPYQVGKLTLQLLYVPRPKGVAEEDMPKSMNACVREMREAEEVDKREHEGFLSQQGGDCPFWRRRYFRLVGSKLTAYHEATRQPRAKIDLAKAAKIIDDRGSLVQNPEGGKSGKGRRKSAFAEEDEGYQFVEEGFRIRFANGETIDFYADKAEDKAGWIEVLQRTVGKNAITGREWCKAVLAREKKNAGLKAKAAEDVHARPQSSDGLAERAPVQKASRVRNGEGFPVMPGTPAAKSAGREREVPLTPQTAPQQGRLSNRRKEVRSMLY